MMRLSLFVFICLSLSFIGICYADIAFVANMEGNWDLFTADDNGRNPVRITTTAFDERDPSWFPDRKQIVYSASDGGIYIADLESAKCSLVLKPVSKRAQITPSVSFDGKRIAFSQFRPPEEQDDTDLLIHHLDTRKTIRLLDQPAIQIWPSWSPDGTRIVYANVHCSSECGRLIQELWVADSKGGWARQLLMTHGFCQQPVWSPDGRRIAFSSDHGGNYDIWIVTMDDGKLQPLTDHQALDIKPAWSPDGSKLAFISTRDGLMQIWMKDLKSGVERKIDPFGDNTTECRDIAW